MWKSLEHRNILPFLGAYMHDEKLVLVSEWMENGNIKCYLQRHREVNKLSLVSHSYSLACCCYLLTP